MREFGWFIVIAGAVAFEALTAPGTALNGQGWKLSRSGSPGMVHFTVERSRPGNRTMTSNDVSLANFHGFTLDMLDHSGPAKFTYAEDAADLQCEGKFSWGRGAGGFTLTPNPAFMSELNRLGFAAPREDELFQMVLTNIKLDFVREVRSAEIATSLRDLLDFGCARRKQPVYTRHQSHRLPRPAGAGLYRDARPWSGAAIYRGAETGRLPAQDGTGDRA